MTGSSPYPPGFGAPPPGSGPPPSLGGRGWSPQQASVGLGAGTKRARSGLLVSAVALAVLLGVAALVLSIIAAGRGPEPSPPPPAHQAEPEELFVDDADKPLCEAIGPLMREQSDRTRNFQNKGDAASPERLGAIPQYKADTLDWAIRIQPLLNQHAEPPRYLTRTLQRYIDGMLLYSENMYPERGPDSFDNTTYESAIVDYGGPLGTCYKVGVKW
jgi:hypothetical protein